MSVALSEKEIFSMAMEVEKSGKAFYETILAGAKDEKIKELFSFLAEQEENHYKFFKKQYENAGSMNISGEDWEDISEYIKATTDSRFFLGEDQAIKAAKKAGGVEEAVDIAISFEKDTLLFFYEIKNVTPAASKEASQKIIDEEKKHVLMLTKKKKEFQGIGKE